MPRPKNFVGGPCQRDGCYKMGLPKYCSRKCAAQANAKIYGPAHFRSIGNGGLHMKRLKGHSVLRQSDVMLMAAGRYAEAARYIYDRGYQSGWQSARRNHRQLPPKRVA